MLGGLRTSVCFDLADGQEIAVRLLEAVYVIRDGTPLLVNPAAIEVDITYNHKLIYIEIEGARYRCKESDKVTVEKNIDIGDDCADKLAKAICVGADRYRKNVARRKKATEVHPQKDAAATAPSNSR